MMDYAEGMTRASAAGLALLGLGPRRESFGRVLLSRLIRRVAGIEAIEVEITNFRRLVSERFLNRSETIKIDVCLI